MLLLSLTCRLAQIDKLYEILSLKELVAMGVFNSL